MFSENPVAAVDDHRITQLSATGEIAIGRIAVWSSLLERNLGELAQRLSEFSLAEPPSPGSRAIKAARRFLKSCVLLSPVESKQILKVLNESYELLEQRNHVIHATIGTSLHPGALTFRNQRKNLDQIHTDEDLDAIAKQLHGLAWDVFDCSMTVAVALGKSRTS